MKNVLIIGGGFAGLMVARRLALSLDPLNAITVVAPNRNFTFYPALVQLAFGKCDVEDITFDLAASLKELGVRFIQGKATGIDPVGQSVQVAGEELNGELVYDYLVIATGRRLATEQVPGFFDNAQHLLGVKPAQQFGELVQKFRSGHIIVGLCPDARLPVPICETAFALSKKFEKEMKNGDVRVSVIFPESLKAAFGGAEIHKELEAAFEHHRVNVLYDVPITKISFNEVFSSNKHKIACDLLMLIPPFRGQELFRDRESEDEAGFIKVDGLMRVHGKEHIYAVGDIVAFSGPKFAHMAVRQAEVAASNLISEIEGGTPDTEYYHEIATIIDAHGADSIYLHYGIWDDAMYRVKKGRMWGWIKESHDAIWRKRHK